MRTDETTAAFTSAMVKYLNVELAPRTSLHGVLVEVYGEGILILGESGVGKSETALEIVKRGHRLIADDLVEVRRVSDKTLLGRAPEIIRHLIEIRGIGILDVKELFGVSAVKMQENVDLHIAYYSKFNIAPFKYKETSYYPIYKRENFVNKVFNILTNYVIFEEHLEEYLKIIRDVKPDIIHIHGTENPFGFIIKHTSIPVVISIQGNITVCYHKFFTGIEKKYARVTNFTFRKPLGFFRNYNQIYKTFYKMEYYS